MCINSYSGVSNSDARNSQSPSVEVAIVTPTGPVARRVGAPACGRELGGNDLGQQTRAAQPLGNRADLGGTGGPDALLRRHDLGVTVPTGVTLLDGAEDKEPSRFQIELLGVLLPDARPRLTAARTQLLRLGQVVNDRTTFEVLGQWRAAVVIALGRWLLGGGNRRWCATFAPATEPVLQGRVELGLEFGVLGAQLLEFG
jgi:hypothetical protein